MDKNAEKERHNIMNIMKDNDNNPNDFSLCRKTDFDQKYK